MADMSFLGFFWFLLTETWLGIFPAVLFLLIALTAYIERGH